MGHDLLPGCQVPWKHDDCPGVKEAEGPTMTPDGKHIIGGGVVCHCPCHRLKKELRDVKRALQVVANSIHDYPDPQP